MGCSRLLLTLLTAEIACGSACLYVPPLNHTAGVGTVDALGAQPAKSRSDVEHGLGGKAEVLRKQGVYVYDWLQNRGHLLYAWDHGPLSTDFNGRHFRALVTFDGDRVVRYERFVNRPKEGEHFELPAADPPDRVRAGCSDEARCVKVAVADGERLIALDAAGNLWTWDGDRARQLARAPSDQGRSQLPTLLTLSADGRYAAFSRRMDTVVFDVVDEREVVRGSRTAPDAEVDSAPTRVLEFTPDGASVVAIGYGKRVQRIDCGNWRAAEGAALQGRPIVSGAFAPGTMRLLATDDDGNLGYVDVWTGKPEPPLVLARTRQGRRVVIAPDARHVALVSGPDVELWDLERLERERDAAPADTPPTFTDGRATQALRGVQLLPFPAVKPACGQGVAFSPDGRSLAVAVGDRIGVFPVDGGPATRWFAAPGQSLCGLAFSRDGSRLFATTPTGLAEWTVRRDVK